MQRTLALIKPDAVAAGAVRGRSVTLLRPPLTSPPLPGHLAAICGLIRAHGLTISAEQSVRIDATLAAALYEQHRGKDFYRR
jgi:nucleoside diphosphate kinase